MKEEIVRITTDDTGKTYEFPGEGNPQIWQVNLQMEALNQLGNAHPTCTEKTVYIERETLEKAGLVPFTNTKPDVRYEPTETAEDLIIRLLEMCEVYPAK